MWILLAVFSAIFAGLTSILAKCGIRQTDSDVATFLRTIVVLIFAWLMVFIVGSAHTIGAISFRSMVFLILSGLATGASWLCYFKALSLGDVNKVVPIDKSSTVLTVLFAIVILGETQSLVVQLGGVVLILMGTLMTVSYTHLGTLERRTSDSENPSHCPGPPNQRFDPLENRGGKYRASFYAARGMG